MLYIVRDKENKTNVWLVKGFERDSLENPTDIDKENIELIAALTDIEAVSLGTGKKLSLQA